ncbi:AraC family transcriptional regulator [Pedobacter sp. SYP-B3415]|uniref:helix-turn-helix domain-containing protein n=1 Tax=Pedobacter sp. SYP-B3415 TaxID=2496641 RepID=UPI00101C844A|nr:AraC family transcriptional regulator [Pedobacter sp. SYP-B3415]
MTYYESEVLKLKKIMYPNSGQLDAIRGTRNYLDKNCSEDLNLDVISGARYMSKFHLLRLFKKYYGQTPIQYLTDKRIEKAKACLKTGMSISETCFAIGFDSPSSFSTLFKSKTGRTPSEFQKSNFHNAGLSLHADLASS